MADMIQCGRRAELLGRVQGFDVGATPYHFCRQHTYNPAHRKVQVDPNDPSKGTKIVWDLKAEVRNFIAERIEDPAAVCVLPQEQEHRSDLCTVCLGGPVAVAAP